MGYEYEKIDGERVEVNVAKAFREMEAAFQKRFGLKLLITSGTRTREEQQHLYNLYLQGKILLAAKPGTSNHEENGPRGPRALDLRDSGKDSGVTRAGNARSLWLKKNASRWGFDPAGYRFSRVEPWHYEYTGELNTSQADPSNVETRRRQRYLNVVRGEKLAQDGIEGPKTREAYKRYQEFLGRGDRNDYEGAHDGIWGSKTQAGHESYTSRLGDDSSVASRQRYLNVVRGEKLAQDGIEGPKTKAAYARYQEFLNEGDRDDYKGRVDGEWGSLTHSAHKAYTGRLFRTTG